MVIQHIISGLAAAMLGILMVRFAQNIINFTGSLQGISSRLGMGSSLLIVKIVGLILVIGGIIYATNLGHFLFGPLVDALSHFLPAK